MNILITGVSGFVGPILSTKIAKEFENCKIFGTYFLHHELELIQDENFIPQYMNLSDINSIRSVLVESRPDIIFHLAAQSSGALSWRDPQLTFEVNVNGSINLIESIIDLKIKPKILCIGSSEQYGLVDDKPISETRTCNPANPYGLSKKVQEELLTMLCKSNNIDIMFTRSFNHTGISQTPIFVIPDWCRQIAKIENDLQEPLLTVGNLDAVRDFSDVNDICVSYVDIIKNGKRYEIYNVGSGEGKSLKYILDYLLSLSKKHIEIVIDKDKLRPLENPIIICDNSKMKSIKERKYKKIEIVLADVLDSWRTSIKENIHD